MNASQHELLTDYSENLLPVFGDPSLVLVQGRGSRVTDADGKTYLDLLAGIAVNSLGHAHPAWVKAVADQAATLAHVSNFFTTVPQVDLAAQLIRLQGATGPSRVFFSNSGTEANEAAYKLARRHGNLHEKSTILALEHGFHGRSLGALALTHKPAYKQPFEPMPAGVRHIPATLQALEENMDEDVAAIIVEPIQGEAGVVPLPDGYLSAARHLTRDVGALLIVDEVQTGIGRTGAWFAHTREIQGQDAPDVVTLAKGLGCGFPVGATMVNGQENIGLLEAGMHGTTFGGNPLAASAALATLTTIEADNLLDRAAVLGEKLRTALEGLECVRETRGAGLLIGVVLHAAQTNRGAPLAPAVVTAARDAGFIINGPDAQTLRLAPALTIGEEELETFVTALPEIVAAAQNSPTAGA